MAAFLKLGRLWRGANDSLRKKLFLSHLPMDQSADLGVVHTIQDEKLRLRVGFLFVPAPGGFFMKRFILFALFSICGAVVAQTPSSPTTARSQLMTKPVSRAVEVTPSART